ncbi:MAG: hypothetical protein KDK99_00100 [Verrucomicrobiales bacterium]|nr:hypothetical protein [Verrucomicrobiales bacterium]
MTQVPDAPSSSDKPAVPPGDSSQAGQQKRAALLADGQADTPKNQAVRSLITGAPNYRRPANVKRSTHAQRLFLLLFVIVLLLLGGMALFGYTFYLREIKPTLSSLQTYSRHLPAGDATPSSAPAVAQAVAIEIPPDVRQEMAASSSALAEIQRQLDSLRKLQADQEGQVRTLADRVASRGAQEVPVSTASSAGVPTEPTSDALIAEANTPSMMELRLLKERNRLTAYADEAIATGEREPLVRIVEAMSDPERANLWHAAKAEYYRVMGHYQFVTRIDPGFRLPLDELYPKGSVRDEADLTTEQLIELLSQRESDWQIRLRSAFLLGGRRTPEVGNALIDALKNDPSLDVAKEAQLSFEQTLGRRFRLFDIPAIESWWQTQVALRSGPAPRAELRAKEDSDKKPES